MSYSARTVRGAWDGREGAAALCGIASCSRLQHLHLDPVVTLAAVQGLQLRMPGALRQLRTLAVTVGDDAARILCRMLPSVTELSIGFAGDRAPGLPDAVSQMQQLRVLKVRGYPAAHNRELEGLECTALQALWVSGRLRVAPTDGFQARLKRFSQVLAISLTGAMDPTGTAFLQVGAQCQELLCLQVRGNVALLALADAPQLPLFPKLTEMLVSGLVRDRPLTP
jgi:hypothetical protein